MFIKLLAIIKLLIIIKIHNVCASDNQNAHNITNSLDIKIDLDNVNNSGDSNSTLVHNNNTTDHLCYRQEAYTELIQTPIKQAVKVRSNNWCLEIPPRCSTYRTEIREVIKLQNITKTKVVEFCCDGYAEITSENETICQPICRGGCGRGYCHEPNECRCDIGYTGRHCTQRCRNGRWGENCKNICKCRNGSICDNRTGSCRCTEGWIGELCQHPCPNGYYGMKCKNICECSSSKCNIQTGDCLAEDTNLSTKITTVYHSASNVMKIPYEHIPVHHSIKLELVGNKMAISNNSTKNSTEKLNLKLVNNLNTTTSIIESLNSTIANLTENIDKLAKNLNRTQTQVQNVDEQVTLLWEESVIEGTTIQSIHEVILINSNYPNSNTLLIEPTYSDIVEPTDSKQIIHVVSNLKDTNHLSDDSLLTENNSSKELGLHGHDVNAILCILAIFGIITVATCFGFIIIYRNHLQRHANLVNCENANSTNMNVSQLTTKPLPNLPTFLPTTSILKKDANDEFYDRPTNNAAIKNLTLPYSYTTTESIYSTTVKSSRKGSLDHIYDEIRYPSIDNSKL